MYLGEQEARRSECARRIPDFSRRLGNSFGLDAFSGKSGVTWSPPPKKKRPDTARWKTSRSDHTRDVPVVGSALLPETLLLDERAENPDELFIVQLGLGPAACGSWDMTAVAWMQLGT